MKIQKRLNSAIVLSLILSMIVLFASINGNSVKATYANLSQEGQGYAINGTHANGFFGVHFDGVGDVSGDGIDDFIIGEAGYGAGRLYLFLGRLDASWNELTLADAHATFIGESSDDWFGRWTAGLGDVNGDSYNDFAVSSMMNDEAGSMAGKVYVFFGSEEGWGLNTPATQANVSIIGEAEDDRLGHGVYGIGDTNGDGYDDFIISGMMNDEGGSTAGQLYLFLGRPQEQWSDAYSAAEADASWIGTEGDGLAFDASGIGDVNNDGFPDFAIGAEPDIGGENSRKVYLIFGSDETNWSMDQPISEANASLVGFSLGRDLSVDWISGAGDVNNDGFDDIIFGAYEEDVEGEDSGQTYLFFGRPTEDWTHDIPFSAANASFLGTSANDYCGWTVDGVGDVNGDSFADIVISAPTTISFPATSLSSGHVYLFLGRSTEKWAMNTSLTQANYAYTTEQEHDGYGFHVMGIGDVNNDNRDDFAIGAPNFDAVTGVQYRDVGKTYIILHHDQQSTWTTATDTTSITSTSTTTTTTPTPLDIGFILILTIPVVIIAVVAIVYLVKKKR